MSLLKVSLYISYKKKDKKKCQCLIYFEAIIISALLLATLLSVRANNQKIGEKNILYQLF